MKPHQENIKSNISDTAELVWDIVSQVGGLILQTFFGAIVWIITAIFKNALTKLIGFLGTLLALYFLYSVLR